MQHTLVIGQQSTNFSVIPSTDPLRVPSLMVDRVTISKVEYQVQSNDDMTDAVITGYEVIRFGVPMIGEYVNAGRGRRVTISPVAFDAQYKIAAWAFNGNHGRRSAAPAVEYAIPASGSMYAIQSLIL